MAIKLAAFLAVELFGLVLAESASPESNWQAIAERFGISFVILCALGLFIWKSLWPFLTEQITSSRVAVEKANEALAIQLASAQSAREAALKEFMSALERRDADSAKISQSLNNLADIIEERRKRRIS